jgi:hypothetical protein
LDQQEGFQHLRLASPVDDRPLEVSVLPYGTKHLRLMLVRDLTLPAALSEELRRPVGPAEVRLH